MIHKTGLLWVAGGISLLTGLCYFHGLCVLESVLKVFLQPLFRVIEGAA